LCKTVSIQEKYSSVLAKNPTMESDGDFITAACATYEEVLHLTHAEVWQIIHSNKG